jgi:hypothetical protein
VNAVGILFAPPRPFTAFLANPIYPPVRPRERLVGPALLDKRTTELGADVLRESALNVS